MSTWMASYKTIQENIIIVKTGQKYKRQTDDFKILHEVQ